MADLNDRQRRLLARLVAEYIEQGEPVSSAWLAENSGLGVSSATVRNILAHLEEHGLLRQPHTSAGRVPTDSGYRRYVEGLLATRKRPTRSTADLLAAHTPFVLVIDSVRFRVSPACGKAVGIARYKEIARGLLMGDETGMLKLLFHRQTHEVLGVHIIGEGATELVHIGQAVMAHRSRIQYFIDTVFNYPTLAECYKVAALDGINRLPRPWAPYR